MRVTNFIITLLSVALSSVVAPAKEKPFEPVEKSVKERTGRSVRWEQDLAAREESRARVRGLLKRPLTVGGAVQVALIHNRGLQATFEEIGTALGKAVGTIHGKSKEAGMKIGVWAHAQKVGQTTVGQVFDRALMKMLVPPKA